MYDITQEDFLKIRTEAFDPAPGEDAFAVTFAVMDRMFPGYLYARRSSFPCDADLEDCLITAQIRIIERLRRYYFEREDMQQSPESLQRWMFTVLKNCHYTVLRQTEAGRELLQRLTTKYVSSIGATFSGEGRLNVDYAGGDGVFDGGFDVLYRQEALEDRRRLLTKCFEEILTGRSDVQIILAWLAVSVRILLEDLPKKEVIAQIADRNPTMNQLFRDLIRDLSGLTWLEFNPQDLRRLAQKLEQPGEDGRPTGELRFSDFTKQSVREYISKSINKRNDAVSDRHAGEADLD